MSPDDPRHGTNAGYRAHFLPDAGAPCGPCRDAHANYHRHRRSRLYLASLDVLTVDALGTARRIQALQALGWTLGRIAAESGYPPKPAFMHNITKKPRVRHDTAQRIAAAYERMSGTPGPSRAARLHAQRNGWPPPLAWDDIDNDERPVEVNHETKSEIDPVVVERLLSGRQVETTAAEKAEVVRRWVAQGRSLAELERFTGWNTNRYRPAKEAS